MKNIAPAISPPAGIGDNKPANQAVLDWVHEVELLAKPENVFWCDGSEREHAFLLARPTPSFSALPAPFAGILAATGVALMACGTLWRGRNGEIAFSGRGHLWVVQPDGTHLRRLTAIHGKAERPAWSYSILTPELVGAVWLGYDQPRSLGRSASGGRLAAPVFGRVLKTYYTLHAKPLPWMRPLEIEERDVDLASGGLAIAGCPPDRVGRELFLPGTAPQDCQEHHGGVIGLIDKVGR